MAKNKIFLSTILQFWESILGINSGNQFWESILKINSGDTTLNSDIVIYSVSWCNILDNNLCFQPRRWVKRSPVYKLDSEVQRLSSRGINPMESIQDRYAGATLRVLMSASLEAGPLIPLSAGNLINQTELMSN